MPNRSHLIQAQDSNGNLLLGAQFKVSINGKEHYETSEGNGLHTVNDVPADARLEVEVTYGDETQNVTIAPDAKKFVVTFKNAPVLVPSDENNPTPWKALLISIQQIPATRYFLGVVGAAGAASVIGAFFVWDWLVALLASLLVFLAAIAVVVYARITKLGQKPLTLPALVLTWVVVVVVSLSAICLFTSFFFGMPLDMRPSVFAQTNAIPPPTCLKDVRVSLSGFETTTNTTLIGHLDWLAASLKKIPFVSVNFDYSVPIEKSGVTSKSIGGRLGSINNDKVCSALNEISNKFNLSNKEDEKIQFYVTCDTIYLKLRSETIEYINGVMKC